MNAKTSLPGNLEEALARGGSFRSARDSHWQNDSLSKPARDNSVASERSSLRVDGRLEMTFCADEISTSVGSRRFRRQRLTHHESRAVRASRGEE